MGGRERNRSGTVFWLALTLALLAPDSAAATTGSIDGVDVEPSLAHATVENLSVAYNGCSVVGDRTCSWDAAAWLVAPPATSCPPNGSYLEMYLGNPPNLSGLGNRRIWSLESTGDASVHSGPLQLNVEGVNDQFLCLYATKPSATKMTTKTLSSGARPAYTPQLPDSSELLASQLLHVEQPATADKTSSGEVALGISGEIFPSKLPRSRPAPVSLRIGFTSEEPGTHTAPELTRIALEFARNVTLQAAGLPRCSPAKLYSTAASARQSCAGSLVGRGSVVSEVTLSGQATATIDGHLLAFYGFAEGHPRILAQVTGEGALPLTYVIPFQIEKAHGAFRTSLVVRKMRRILGRCAGYRPNCFSQPYTLKGVYGHISRFELTLKRRFTRAGGRESFVNADCPARGRQLSAGFEGVSVNYDQGSRLGGEGATLLGRCEVAN